VVRNNYIATHHTHAGKDEILNRRIGRHELAAIEVCRGYVNPQHEYYLCIPQGDMLLQYVQQFANTEASAAVMTFIVNHDGVLYQKDLGSSTAAVACAMTQFNPDSTWKPL
jgi:hypothetical protein